MKVVIDANIVLSALVAGNLSAVLFSPKLELFAPDLLFSEIRNNREAIERKSRLGQKEIDVLLSLLEKKIRVMPAEAFMDTFTEAESILKEHTKDTPYVALALKLQCPFWTYEKRFAGKLATITTADLRKLLGNEAEEN
jgi:predicted nucleic acid-binding protein